jgi:Uma2 family endonuclease
MADALRQLMSAEEFLEWNLDQDQKYELIDGVPVPMRAMAGASSAHDQVVVNLIRHLGNRLDGTPCRPTTADLAIRTSIRRVRRPDVTVECAPVALKTYEATNPLAVFEVLSPATRQTDVLNKLEEYKRHPSLRCIVHIDPETMSIVVYARATTGEWEYLHLDQPTDMVVVPDTPARLSLAEIYNGVPLASWPTSQ